MADYGDLLFVITTALAILFVGIAKAGFGGLIGSVAMPLVAAVSDMGTAIAVLLPLYVVMDVIAAGMLRRDMDRWFLPPMILAGLAGTALGAAVFRSLDPTWLRIGLGLLSILQGARYFWARRGGRTPPAAVARHNRAWPALWGWCGLAGFTSFFLMGDGPAQVYLMRYRLAPAAFVGTMVGFFLVINASKLPIVAGFGMIDAASLGFSALFLPLAPLGLLAGRQIVRTLPREPFYVAAHVLLVLLGLYLIISGLGAA